MYRPAEKPFRYETIFVFIVKKVDGSNKDFSIYYGIETKKIDTWNRRRKAEAYWQKAKTEWINAWGDK